MSGLPCARCSRAGFQSLPWACVHDLSHPRGANSAALLGAAVRARRAPAARLWTDHEAAAPDASLEHDRGFLAGRLGRNRETRELGPHHGGGRHLGDRSLDDGAGAYSGAVTRRLGGRLPPRPKHDAVEAIARTRLKSLPNLRSCGVRAHPSGWIGAVRAAKVESSIARPSAPR